LKGLPKAGIEIAGRMPIETPINSDNRRYMHAKAMRGGHQLGHVIAALAETAEADAQVARLVP
jgi:GTP cyclohydrolase II